MTPPSPTDAPARGEGLAGPVVVFAALDREVALLKRELRRRPPALLVKTRVTGVGPERARRAAEEHVRDGGRLVVVCGYAGALTADHRVGDLVRPRSVVSEGGDEIAFPQAGPDGSRLVTTDRVVGDAAARRSLADRTGATVVDMETHPIAAVCRDRGVPCVSLRVVTDDLCHGLPPELAGAATEAKPGMGGLLAAIARRPVFVSELVRLGRVTAAANRRLATAVREQIDRTASR